MVIVLPRNLANRLAKVAKRAGRRTDQLAHEALLQWIEDAEDVYEAERALRRVRSGRERTYTLHEVATRLGL